MASASSLKLRLSNGQVLSVAILSAAAVGTSPSVNFEGAATSSHGSDFIPKSDCCIVDQLNLTATAGEMEVYNVTRSQRTGRFIDQIGTNFAVTVTDRAVPKICFRGGNTYRFIQTVAQTAA